MRKSVLRLAVLSTPLLLGACGEGWEMQKTTTMFPYGNQRTAGTGVAYVRAKLLPKKELKVESAIIKDAVNEPVIEPVLDAEEIFTEKQIKGGSVSKSKPPKGGNKDITAKHSSIEVEDKSEKLVNADPEKLNSGVQTAKTIKTIIATASISEIEPLAGDELDLEMAVIEQEIGTIYDEGDTLEIYEIL